jgi:hypothetical protein
VPLQEAQHSALLATLAVLASLKATLGDLDLDLDLDRVSASLLVNGEAGYPQTSAVMNAFSELIIDLYGTDRSADWSSPYRTGPPVRTVSVSVCPSSPTSPKPTQPAS